MPATAFSQIGQIASTRRVHEAFQWLHLHEQQIMRWQVDLVSIPAPPFAEAARAEWLVERFREIGLSHVHLDGAGNALGILPSLHTASSPDGESTARNVSNMPMPRPVSSTLPSPLLLLSAHIDTVFPAHTPLEPTLEGNRLTAPGACDNGAGVVALLALASALMRSGLRPDVDILFAGNVGEEGEGDLRGMRHIYASAAWQGRILAHLVLDGAGHEIAVTRALGSRRFEVVIEGSGGHSWTDAGRPNPIIAMGEIIATMNRGSSIDDAHTAGESILPSLVNTLFGRQEEVRPRIVSPGMSLLGSMAGCADPAVSPVISRVRSTWNVGTIEGGVSVNSIPEHARARFDLRSTAPDQLVRLEVELHRAVEDVVLAANTAAEAKGVPDHPLRFAIESIGSRPAGNLPENARLLDLLRAVDRHLNLRTECRTASTDANIPLSLGVEAASIGAGGDGGGIHTRGEWYDARGRDLGLRRVLLLLLALASHAEPAMAAD